MAKYTRKTCDIYVIEANYFFGHGFEEVNVETSFSDAKRSVKEYRENDSSAIFRIVKKRIAKVST